MPCLNEAETLETCIRKARLAIEEAHIAGEVIIADNGSTDGSMEIAKRLGARVVQVEAKGYGNALMGGIAAAAGKFIVMGDADESYDFSHIPRFVDKMRAGADLVMGNRFRGGIVKDAMPPLHQYFGNPALTRIGRLFFGSPVGDFYCGLRGFRKESYQRLGLRTTGMEFATEMVVKATLLRLNIAEVPTTLSPDGRSRPPHLRTWRDGWRTLRFFLLYSPRWLFLYPGSALMLAGSSLGLWLLRPTAFLGLDGLDTISHGVFWSFFFNVGLFVVVSLLTEQDADDRAQAAAFVGVAVEDKPTPGAPAILSAPEIERLVHHYVGDEDAEAIVRELFGAKAPADLSVPELLEMRIRFERLLAASLGAAAARIIVEDHFTISKEEAQQLVTSFQHMQQSLRVTEEEVKRGERLLASVVESVDDCIFTADTTGRLVTMNPAGRRLLGYELFEVSRLRYPDLLAADERGGAGGIVAALEVGRGWSGQVTGHRGRGDVFPAHLALTALFDDRGQRMGTVGVLHDLTEQVETQRRLIHREKLASLGEMAAGVAHEIRNPLGGIKMATNLLSSPEVDGSPLSQEMARSILSGIGEIEGIINNLLDWTRDARLERNEYELARILDPVVEAAAGEGRSRGLQVGYGRLERDVIAAVDGQKLRQVFTNVMKNAVEAIDPRRGAGRVTVDLFAEGDRAVVEVVDDGVGISPEDRDKIFLPFFTTKPSGTGLGMSIVKKIVDLHAGDIAIESAPGRGTRVRISFPAVGAAQPVAGGTP